MAIFDLYSKRQKRLRGEVPDIYTYDDIPQTLKVQIVHIIRDAIGTTKYSNKNVPNEVYGFLLDTLCREYGTFSLGESKFQSSGDQVLNFLLQTTDTEEIIDVVEFSFRYLEIKIKENYHEYTNYSTVKITPDEAIAELNERFKEHGENYKDFSTTRSKDISTTDSK